MTPYIYINGESLRQTLSGIRMVGVTPVSPGLGGVENGPSVSIRGLPVTKMEK